MSLSVSSVGNSLTDSVYVDTRWLISYSVGIQDYNPMLVETSTVEKNVKTNDFHVEGLQGRVNVAHPVFVWAVEWPAVWRRASTELYHASGGSAVHYGQDIIIHRPIQSGDVLQMNCTLIDLKKRYGGTTSTLKFQHKDQRTNQPVCTTWNTSYWKGTQLTGGDRACMKEHLPPFKPSLTSTERKKQQQQPLFIEAIPIAPYEGVVYAECARIWNPIHSDRSVAKYVGLPNSILHGTATMAKAISIIVKKYCDNNPSYVKRVCVEKFQSIVLMPSVVTLKVLKIHAWKENTVAVHYSVLNEGGNHAIVGGLVIFQKWKNDDAETKTFTTPKINVLLPSHL
jgi:acyl dehydratase